MPIGNHSRRTSFGTEELKLITPLPVPVRDWERRYQTNLDLRNPRQAMLQVVSIFLSRSLTGRREEYSNGCYLSSIAASSPPPSGTVILRPDLSGLA
jgi:hypothetical protein